MTQLPPELSERDQADLAALADGSLAEPRRGEVEARVAASPALQEALDRQRVVLTEIREADDRAPDRLHAWLQEEGAAAAPPRSPARRRPWVTRRLGGAVAVACAAAVALVLALSGGTSAPSALAQAAARPVSGPAPAAGGLRLRVKSDGLAFPNWEPRLGWRATGVRTDRVDGRQAVTVSYARAGRTMRYAILARPPADLPAGESAYRSFAYDGKPAVIWHKDGRTCLLLGGRGVDDSTLRFLASTVKFY